MAWYFYGTSRTNYNNTLLLSEHKKILETSIAKISEQKKAVEEKLAALVAENSEAIARIDEYSAKVEAMTSEYETNMKKLLAELDKSRAEIAAFNQELSGKNSEIRFLKKTLKKIDGKMKEAISKSDGKPVNLEPIVVTTPKKVSGKILEVNKAYGFVIVNLGVDDGISDGDTLFVSRRKALLGKILVEETAEKNSAARIMYKTLGDVVRKGDTVTN